MTNKEAKFFNTETSELELLTAAGNGSSNSSSDGTNILGFTIDDKATDPESSVVYVADNKDFTPMKVADYGDWESFVKSISRPVLLRYGAVRAELSYDDFTLDKNGKLIDRAAREGDVMIEFKHLYIKEIRHDDGKRTVLMSTTHFDGATSYTKRTERGYNQMTRGIMHTLQELFLLLYKSKDSQAALGKGYTGFTTIDAAAKAGDADKLGYFYGDQTGKKQVKFCGIEDMWGNYYEFVDGIRTGNDYSVQIAYGMFDRTNNGYEIHKVGADSRDGCMLEPFAGEVGYVIKSKADSYNDSFKDNSSTYGGKVMAWGGDKTTGNKGGMFSCMLKYNDNQGYGNVASRLTYVTDEHFYVGAYLATSNTVNLGSNPGGTIANNISMIDFRTQAQFLNTYVTNRYYPGRIAELEKAERELRGALGELVIALEGFFDSGSTYPTIEEIKNGIKVIEGKKK